MQTITLIFNLLGAIVLYGSRVNSKVVVVDSVISDCASKQWVNYLIQLPPHPQVTSKYESPESSSYDSDDDIYVNNIKTYCTKSQTKILDYLEQEKRKGRVQYYKSYYVTNTLAVTSTKEVVERVRDMEEVEEISSNNKFKVRGTNALDENGAVTANEVKWTGSVKHWSLSYINATKLPKFVFEEASKLVYANADTGVEYRHPALAANYRGKKGSKYDHNYNWYDANQKTPVPNPNPSAKGKAKNTKCQVGVKYPCGDDDHGSHAMSTVVGKLGLGVSPQTKWIACKNMDMNFGSPESYLGCLQFFLEPTNLQGKKPNIKYRPHVVGNSYNCPPEEGCSILTFTYAMKALKKANIFMSVSAGNSGDNGCSTIKDPPAIDPNAFTVGALKYKSDLRASFSSLGPVPKRTKNNLGLDIAAPGVNITGAALGGTYKALDGTSMAAPHVSGAALLVMAACPRYKRDVEGLYALLRKTAKPLYPILNCGGDTRKTYPNNEFGYGRLNVGKAIDLCLKAWPRK